MSVPAAMAPALVWLTAERWRTGYRISVDAFDGDTPREAVMRAVMHHEREGMHVTEVGLPPGLYKDLQTDLASAGVLTLGRDYGTDFSLMFGPRGQIRLVPNE